MRIGARTTNAKERARRPGGGKAAIRRGLKGPLLVAASGDAASIGALRFAESLARRERVKVHVLGVMRPMNAPVWLPANIDLDTLEAGRRVKHLDALRRRVHQSVGRSALFTIEVASGHPPRALAEAARARGSACVVVGLASGDAAERRETEDEILETSRATDRPVVAVPSDHTLLPTRALVAVDFGESSRRAAFVARLLLGPGATMTLMHVATAADLRVPGQERLAEIYERSATQLLRDLAKELERLGDVSVDTVLATGDPAHELLAHAERDGVDLVACGTQGGAAREQYFTGSVSTALLRGAACAVLLTPPEQ